MDDNKFNTENFEEKDAIYSSNSLFSNIDFDSDKDQILEKISFEPFLKNINIDQTKTIITNFTSISSPSKYTRKNRVAQTLIIKQEVEYMGASAFEEIENLIYLGSCGLPSYNFFKTCKKIPNIIFIDSGFLSGKVFLLEGCIYIINNFEYFTDKKGFISALKKKTDKIKNLVRELIYTNNLNIIGFLIDSKIATYDFLVELTKTEIEQEIKMFILSKIDDIDDDTKNKYNIKVERKENIDLGLINYSLSDLRNDFACTKKDGKIYLTKYKKDDEILTIPSCVDGITDFVIKDLNSKHKIKKIYIEEGVTSVEYDTQGYNELGIVKNGGIFVFFEVEEVHLPSSLKFIDPELFASKKIAYRQKTTVYCNNRTNTKNVMMDGDVIIQQGSIVYINNKIELKEFTIPFHVTSIATNLFRGATNLEKVELPPNLFYIGRQAFSGTRLKTIILPDSIKKIGYEAFSFTKISSVLIPKCITKLNKSEFYRCRELSEIILHNSIEEFQMDSLQNNKISKVFLPKSIKNIYHNPTIYVNNCEKVNLDLIMNELSFSENGIVLNITSRDERGFILSYTCEKK